MSGTKNRKSFTVLLVPRDQSSVLRFNFSLLWVQAAAVTLVGMIVAVLLFASSYQELSAEVGNLRQLRVINRRQNEEIAYLVKETQLVKGNLEELASLDSQVRQLLRMEPPPELAVATNSIRGVGGGDDPVSSAVAVASTWNNLGGVDTDPVLADALVARERLADIRQEMDIRVGSLHALVAAASRQQALLDATPSIWPVSGSVSSWFGYRRSPFGRKTEFHGGLDISAGYGTPVVATAAGTVTLAGWSAGYGKTVEINHGYGYRTLYGHNSRLAVRSGQRVERGDVIAFVGSTGRSTGPHLHYEVYENGRQINPRYFLDRPTEISELGR